MLLMRGWKGWIPRAGALFRNVRGKSRRALRGRRFWKGTRGQIRRPDTLVIIALIAGQMAATTQGNDHTSDKSRLRQDSGFKEFAV
jgi:hypothetical protein